MATCSRAPRSNSSMNGSPATCWENRVHRAHSTQRSRSRSTSLLIGSGLGKVRLTSTNRLSVRPLLIAWFCNGHSPPLSQTGQSSGWLISSSSIVPCCALSATGLVSWVLTTIPSVTGMVQDATGLRWPSTSTRHCRQAPTGSSSGWSQKPGVCTPVCSAARMISVPLGTATSKPSMVQWTASGGVCGPGAPGGTAGAGGGLVNVTGPPRWRSSGRCRGVLCSCVPSRARSRGDSDGLEPEAAAQAGLFLQGQQRDVVVAEVLQRAADAAGRTVTQGAERAAQDVVAGVGEQVQVGRRPPAVDQPLQDLHQPEGPLAARGALAAALV